MLTVLDAGKAGEVEEVGVARLALAAVAERGVAGLARSPRPAAHGGADCTGMPTERTQRKEVMLLQSCARHDCTETRMRQG